MNLDQGAKQQEREHNERDTHASPPQQVHDVYRKYQRMSDQDVNCDPEIIDFSRGLSVEQLQKVKVTHSISGATATKTFRSFLDDKRYAELDFGPCMAYEHVDFPGLRLFPNLLPPQVQTTFVDRLLHRDLSNPLHKTNLHDDYNIPYVRKDAQDGSSESVSFFTQAASKVLVLQPREPGGRPRPLDLSQFLSKRWRYLTLGTQYDWSTRSYPSKDRVTVEFPSDIAGLVSGLFPQVRAESGVVLVYSPKDFMPVHRDVSEMCERDLCSFSLGCDGLFVVALEDCASDLDANFAKNEQVEGDDSEKTFKTIIIRVRSGDMIQMSGAARWAWHAMPKVMAGTCPDFLRDWPIVSSIRSEKDDRLYKRWKGFMNRKRINISCRQVFD